VPESYQSSCHTKYREFHHGILNFSNIQLFLSTCSKNTSLIIEATPTKLNSTLYESLNSYTLGVSIIIKCINCIVNLICILAQNLTYRLRAFIGSPLWHRLVQCSWQICKANCLGLFGVCQNSTFYPTIQAYANNENPLKPRSSIVSAKTSLSAYCSRVTGLRPRLYALSSSPQLRGAHQKLRFLTSFSQKLR